MKERIKRLKHAATHCVFFIKSPHIFNADTVFALLLIGSTLLRLDAFQYPHYYYHTDWDRDYLVAHHIVQYGEVPLTPPETGSIGMVFGSPFYFYFLAAQLMIKDDVVFLGLANLFLQVIAVVIVYVLAKGMYGNTTALIAAVLFGFAENVLNQSNTVWQPHTMQPFILLTFLLLFLSYRYRNYPLILGSVFLFPFAGVLHTSAFAIFPVYATSVVLVSRTIVKRRLQYAGIVASFCGALALLYVPRFLFSLWYPSDSSLLSSSVNFVVNQNKNLADISHNFLSRTGIFFKFVFISMNTNTAIIAASVGLFIAVFVYLRNQKDGNRKKYTALLCFSVGWFLVTAAFINAALPPDPFPPRYFVPILGIFIILLSEIIDFVCSRMANPLLGKIALTVAVLYVISPSLSLRAQETATRHLMAKSNGATVFSPPFRYGTEYDVAGFSAMIGSFLHFPRYVNHAIDAVENEVRNIKAIEKRPDFLFFQLREYRVWSADNDAFIVALEDRLKTKLTRVTQSYYSRGYDQIAHPYYMFVICPQAKELNDGKSACPEIFFDEHKNYTLVKEIYFQSPYKIYLAKEFTDSMQP